MHYGTLYGTVRAVDINQWLRKAREETGLSREKASKEIYLRSNGLFEFSDQMIFRIEMKGDRPNPMILAALVSLYQDYGASMKRLPAEAKEMFEMSDALFRSALAASPWLLPEREPVAA